MKNEGRRRGSGVRIRVNAPDIPIAILESPEKDNSHLLELNLVTALVPSEMACLDSSPGRMRRTDVWISREEMVDFLLYDASLDASPAATYGVSPV